MKQFNSVQKNENSNIEHSYANDSAPYFQADDTYLSISTITMYWKTYVLKVWTVFSGMKAEG